MLSQEPSIIYFRQWDEMRRNWGLFLDSIGMGPQETTFRMAASRPGMKLRAYAHNGGGSPVMLIVPAPIKQPYIWDLLPGRSVVRYCLEKGIRLYLIEWAPPPADGESAPGLADYADSFISEALQVIADETGRAEVILSAHSLGGTLAAIFAALHPEQVRGLILLGSPIHFDGHQALVRDFIKALPRHGSVPGSFLSFASWIYSPTTFGVARWMDRMASISDEETLRTHRLVERWTLDELPVSALFLKELLEKLYDENQFVRAGLRLGKRRADPKNITAAVLSVVDRNCPLAPPEAVLPLYKALKHEDKQIVWQRRDKGVSLQHVAPLAGESAFTYLWPQAVEWIYSHWD